MADSNPLCAGLGAEQELCLERVNSGMHRFSTDAATLASNTVLIQHGTQVTALTTWPELLAFLGPVDSFSEAALVAYLRGFYVACDVTTGELRGSDWVFTVQSRDYCNDVHADHEVLVRQDGSLQMQRTFNYWPGPQRCVQ